MRIRRLQIQGFKSFADRTLLELDDGITVVVGPNGCGKSNIVDAIRWALGEQSAKRLRGEKMEELLFNGTAERPAEGYAEVTLTFVREDGSLPLEDGDSPLSKFTEIEVTRRLHRSGESEYLLNRVSSRLKDIRELFLDTGVGSRAYSIVEQGHISEIVMAKPEERRVFIEEAAAIGMYKWRRLAAERKLEAAALNLTRIQDILSEIQRQMRSLNRQAKKAERYQRLKHELKEIELSLVKEDFDRLQQKIEDQRRRLSEGRAQLQTLEAQLREKERFLAECRAKQSNFQKRVQANQDFLLQIQGEIHQFEQEASYHLKEIERLCQFEEENRGLLKETVREIEQCKKETERLQIKLENRVEEVNERRQLLEKLESQVHHLENEVEESEKRLQELSGSRFELLTQVSKARNQLTALESELENLEQRRSDAQRERAKIEEERNGVDSELQGKREEYEMALAHRKEGEEKVRLESEKEGELKATLERLTQEFQREAEEKVRCHSRLQSLKELEAASYEEGVRALLKERAQGMETSVKGVVAEAMEVPKEYELAVEAALGDRLQNMIVESTSEGVAAVRYLKSRGLGRGTFIPLDLKSFEEEALSREEREEVITPLIDVVKVREGFHPILHYLLGDVVVVKDLSVAHELWKRNGHRHILVTLEGDRVEPCGVVSGGKRAGMQTGILGRKREIRELEQDLIRADRECRRIQTEMGRVSHDLQQVQNRLKDWMASSTQGIIDMKSLEQRQEQLSREKMKLDEKIETIDLRLQQIAEAKLRIENERRRGQEGLDRLLKQGEEIDQERMHIQQKSDRLRPQVDRARLEFTEERVRIAAEEERAESIRKELSLMIQKEHELEERKREIERKIEHCQNETRRLNEERSRTLRACEAKRIAKEERQKILAAYQEEHSSIEVRVQKTEDSIRKARGENDRIKAEIHQIEIDIVDSESKRDRMIESMQQKHQTRIDEWRFPSEEDRLPRAERERRLADLEEELARIGEVSLGALEEYGELERREAFLSKQKSDLDTSIQSLREAIRKIDRTTRQRFRETFEAIDQQFRTLFPKLFRGGRAQLILTNPNDTSETGVDIFVQPPGKKLQNIQLLSGGEKALSAIALIFSIFLVKPSPFCLLDEVDAPLDDVNIRRFTELVQELSSKTQFLIITHNKKTMEMANTLYGVTMQPPGVSRLLTVNLV